jgi:hypothetical protein
LKEEGKRVNGEDEREKNEATMKKNAINRHSCSLVLAK